MIVKTPEISDGHFYTQTGEPAYRVIGKNGVERNTKVSDARERGLVPSVTTILGIVSKPGLNTWLQQQVLLAALTLPRVEGESEENWLQRVMADSKTTGREAAERGTRLHKVLEDFYKGKVQEYPSWVYKVKDAVDAHFGMNQIWEAERSFAAMGYGGKVDLIAENIVIDFKSKDGDLSKVTPYHEQVMQLAAYREGLKKFTARCANVFFNETGDVLIKEHSEADLLAAWDCFQYLLAFYKRKNNL